MTKLKHFKLCKYVSQSHIITELKIKPTAGENGMLKHEDPSLDPQHQC